MAKTDIKAGETGFISIGFKDRPKDGVDANYNNDYVELKDRESGEVLLFAQYGDVLLDGVQANSIAEVREFVQENFFDGGSGSSGGRATFIPLTRAEVLTAVQDGTLKPGAMYLISGCDAAMYGGTDVYLTALSANSLSKVGHGKFYNPKYNYALGANSTWGIWSKQMFGTFARVGNSRFSFDEIVTADSGATAKWRGDGWIEFVSGNWNIATSATGANGGTATVAGMASPTYAAGTNVIWGGKHWVNVSGLAGDSTTPYTLNGEWAVVPYDAANYNVVYDAIEYDFANDWITYRREAKGNNHVRCSSLKNSASGDAIKAFQWGNPYTTVIDAGNRNVTVENSFMQNINNYCRFDMVTMVFGASFSNILSKPGRARFRNLMFHQASINGVAFTQISESSFTGFASIASCSLVAGSIERLNMDDNAALSNFNFITNPSNLGSGINGHLSRSTVSNTYLSQGLISVSMIKSTINGANLIQTSIEDCDLNNAIFNFTNTGFLTGAKSIKKAMFSNVSISADMSNSASLFLATPRRITGRADGTPVTVWIDNNNLQVLAETAL